MKTHFFDTLYLPFSRNTVVHDEKLACVFISLLSFKTIWYKIEANCYNSYLHTTIASHDHFINSFVTVSLDYTLWMTCLSFIVTLRPQLSSHLNYYYCHTDTHSPLSSTLFNQMVYVHDSLVMYSDISNDMGWKWLLSLFTFFVKFLSYFQLPIVLWVMLYWVIFTILSSFCWEELFLSVQMTPISISQFSQRITWCYPHTYIHTNGVTRLRKVSCRKKNIQLDFMTNWQTQTIIGYHVNTTN